MLKTGNLVPATFKLWGEVYTGPDICKFYTCCCQTVGAATADEQRHPRLYTSLNGGKNWTEETANSTDFYNINYGGQFLFDATNYKLQALGHKSLDSSYDTIGASCGDSVTKTGIKLGQQNWTSDINIPYSTANVVDRYLIKQNSKYFGIRNGGGYYIYNTSPLTIANWTTTRFTGSSGSNTNRPDDDGCFNAIAINNEEGSKEVLPLMVNNTTNNYIKAVIFNSDTLAVIKDFTSILFGSTSQSRDNFQYCSVFYIPKIGYVFFYNKYGTDFRYKILYTYNPSTGVKLQTNNYMASNELSITGLNDLICRYGARGYYCPWTKEFYLALGANQVMYTKDLINWTFTNTTSESASTQIQKLLTDGQNIIMALGNDVGNYHYYSPDKGQTWIKETALSPQGFWAGRSSDTLILPFKCGRNNINLSATFNNGSIISTVDGSITTNIDNGTYISEYYPVTANTSYVAYGKHKTNGKITENCYIAWYDSNKDYISSTTSSSYLPVITTPPSGAAYARISFVIYADSVDPVYDFDDYRWYFAKEDDFKVMTDYGDLVIGA